MKFKRQAAILEIISNREVKTQEELSRYLCEQGFQTTQATISRDIKELRLIKVASHSGGYQYSTPDQSGSATHLARLKNIFRECVVKIDRAQNLVVLKTLVGMANAAATAIDAMKIPNIVGTIAGDDNILIILRTSEEAEQFCELVSDMLA
ncbi:MAG: arginine repressor [Clostridia bacterium]|nr:arginine repressor [Clostridia bacterium]